MTPLRVVLIGPECTGKTSLAGELAVRYDAPLSIEYARDYVTSHPGELTYADVEPIALGQRHEEDAALAQAARSDARLVLLDTDLVSTMVYSRHYYDGCPGWVEAEAVARLGDLYLLHQVDVEWVADAGQRVQPERREELYVRFRLTLELLGARVAEIEGDWDERCRRAVAAIDVLLANPPAGC